MQNLIIGRRIGERVRVKIHGVEVWVTVIAKYGGGVRLGFECPPEAEVLRAELVKSGDKANG